MTVQPGPNSFADERAAPGEPVNDESGEAEGNHPAVTRAAELLDGISGLPVDEHGERYEQAHAELQAALADAERPGPAGAR